MKIGIISDTHIGLDTARLENFLEDHLKGVDTIIHAGDYLTLETIDVLNRGRKFTGVRGNLDSGLPDEIVRDKEILEIEGFRIGIVHGHGTGKATLDRAFDMFRVDSVDIIVFGHSHKPFITTKEEVLVLNPGSPTSKRREKLFSYIILELKDSIISVTLNLFP